MRTVACEIGPKHPFIKSADAVKFKETLTCQGAWPELEEDGNQEGNDLNSSQDAMVTVKEIELFILDGTELGAHKLHTKRRQWRLAQILVRKEMAVEDLQLMSMPMALVVYTTRRRR